ncbi:MAG: HTTM domain-containing protein [Planctomycetota bacterium]
MGNPDLDSTARLIRFRRFLAQETDGASLAFFRIAFGLVMFVHAMKYLIPQGGTTLKDYLYQHSNFNFTYPGFSWVQPFPEPFWTLFFYLTGVAALGVAFGLFYRTSAVLLCICYSYIFLSELAKYNNHYYLMCLFALLLAFMPADRRFSVSAWWRRRGKQPTPSDRTVPYWTVFLLRAQLFIVYFYGGVAKINADWLTGIPMVGKGDAILSYWKPILGLPEIDPIWVGLFICWFGLVFDLSIGFLLICRRTRLLGFALTLIFHVSNHFLFPIGIFPVLALSATTIFLEPDWPVRLSTWVRRPRLTAPDWNWCRLGIFVLPPVGFLLGWKDRISGYSLSTYKPVSVWTPLFVVCFLGIQVGAPFRHLFIDGDANWTEEGQDFSWRMMLRAKDASHVIFHVVDESLLSVDSRGDTHVDWSKWPEEQSKMIFVPVESSRFNWAHHPGLTATYEPNVGIRAVCRVSSDEDAGTKRQQLIEQWRRLLGRQVSVEETIGFEEAISLLRQRGSAGLESTADLLSNLTAQASTASGLHREQLLVMIGRELESISRGDEGAFVRSILLRLHPFLMQGNSFPGERFLVVNDPNLASDSHAFQKLAGGRESLVWIDLGRLRPSDWKGLPRSFVTFEDRELRVVWNYSGDLNHIQLRRFSTSPWMIRQFGSHIANQWEQQTGRRPSIRVVSNLMMNYRVPQPLVDPNVDIASTDYKLTGHNTWILPLSSEVGSATVRVAARP